MKTVVKQFLFVLAIVLLLASCFSPGPTIPAAQVTQIVGKKVLSLLFLKTVLDPLWETIFGLGDAERIRVLKSELAPIIRDSVINALPESEHGSDGSYRCEKKGEQEQCQMQLEKQSQNGFNAYAEEFVAAFDQCRHQTITGSIQYGEHYQQVEAIGVCLSNRGYKREVAVIDKHLGFG